MASWASLVPYAKDRLAVNESMLGLLLLCLGLGALFAMPFAGALTARYGCKKIQNICIPIYCAALVLLTVVPTPLTLAITLVVFGAMSGVLDVVMNLQVVFLEQVIGRRMMSRLHAMYMVGAAVGAGGMALFFGLGLAPFDAVLLLGVVCYILYMIEGVIMDWSALFMNAERNTPITEAGLAYGLFAVTMTFGRFYGDRLGEMLGAKKLLIGGCVVTSIGFALLYYIEHPIGSYLSFFLIGVGAANTVPMLFTITSKQKSMEISAGIAAVSTIGYMGLLSGPAFMGFVAEYFGLPRVFFVMAILVGLMAIVSLRIKEEG